MPKTRKIPLTIIFIVPFVLEILATVGLVGYLSFTNAQNSVQELAKQLISETGNSVQQEIQNFLKTLPEMTQNNQDLLETGVMGLDDDDMDDWLPYLYRQYDNYESNYITAIMITNKQGEFRASGIAHTVNGELLRGVAISGKNTNFAWIAYGKIKSLSDLNNLNDVTPDLVNQNFNVKKRPWYKLAIEAKKPIWVEIFPRLINKSILALGFSRPIYIDDSSQPVGVATVQIDLSYISEFLKTLNVSKYGQIVILDKSGNLVAISTEENPAFLDKNNQAQRLNLEASKNPLTREIANYIKNSDHNFYTSNDLSIDNFKFNNNQYFIKVLPVQDKYGLDWLIAIAIPESAFMEEIYKNTIKTIILSILALVIAIIIGILTSRLVTQPILELNKAAKNIAQGNLNTTVNIPQGDVIGELATSFNQMAYQLKSVFITLEERVKQRTQELEIAKQKAEIANETKSAFIANMSHELRTPLNAILGFSKIMTRSPKLNSDDQENLQIINRSGEYLLALINNILDLSKIEAGKMELNSSNFDFYLLIKEIEDLFIIKAEANDLSFLIEIEPNVPQYIHTDETKLRQILVNLINNAIKFTKEGGIYIKIYRQDLTNNKNLPVEANVCVLFLEVKDTGMGIADHEFEKLFEYFGQTKTGIDSQEGTGLGLPISRKFVQLMGGDIKVESKVGVGTTFICNIQASIVKSVALKPVKLYNRVIGLQPNQPQYRILIVDDKRTNRTLLIKLLKPIGFQLKEASNGQEAIEIWDNWEPHLIWMDMRMPIVDGYEATKYIKGTVKGNATVVIALTASIIEEERMIILSAGCDDFIRKPFRESTIFDTMAKYLGVKYCHEKDKNIVPLTPVTYNLKPNNLKVMPASWREQLYQATIDLDDELINELIKEIPLCYSSLAQKLTDLCHDFQLNIIRKNLESLRNNN